MSSTYTRDQIAGALRRAGFPASSISTWTAIVLAESSGRSDATNDTRDVDPAVLAARGHSAEYSLGPFQINMVAHQGRISEADARDIDKAAAFAFELSGGGKNMNPWGAFTDGRYKQFVGEGGQKPQAQPVKPGSPPPWLGGGEEEVEPEDAEGKSKLKVPSNLVPIIQAVSDETGVPFHVIAGVIQTQAGWSGSIVPELIVDVALKLKEQVGPGTADTARGEEPAWDLIARNVFGAGRDSWLKRYEANVYATTTVRDDKGKVVKDAQGKPVTKKGEPSWIEVEPTQRRTESFTAPNLGGGVGGYKVQVGDGPKINLADMVEVYELIEGLTGERPTDAAAQKYVGMPVDSVRAALIATPAGALWRKHGPAIQQARQWATSDYRSYLGRDPTNAELVTIITNGWNPEALTSWLRGRPYGKTTLGQLADVKATAKKYAREELGRDADAGEIEWIIANTPGTATHIAAYYEQLKTRIDSGDPAFAWATDPDSWRSAQKQVQNIWTQAGMTGAVDPRLVNKAAAEKWTARDIATHVDGMPAPGFQQGITVGEVARVSKIAGSWKEHYLPGTPLTKEEMLKFVQMGSDDIRLYYRSLPAEMGRKARLGNPNSEQEDSDQGYKGVDGKSYDTPTLPFEGAIFSGGSKDGTSTFWQDPKTGAIKTVQSKTSMLPTEAVK